MSIDPRIEQSKAHLDADTDSSITAIHHTLGHGTFQASPGSHRHDGTDSHRLRAGDLQTISATYQPTFTGTGLIYTGTPVVGTYVLIGNLCHFRIKINFSTTTNFGTGQYFTTLPFPPKDDYVFREGGLHADSYHYAIMGDAEEGTTELSLWCPTSSGQDTPFNHNTPRNMLTSYYFYVSGTYEIEA